MPMRTTPFIVPLVLVILTVLSCGGPYVEHSTISSKVRDVDHWRIEWAGRTDSTRAAKVVMAAIDDRSRYTRAEYCVQYVQKIKETLRGRHDVSFAENFPGRGLITVELHGATLSRYRPPDPQAEERLRGDPAHPGYPEGQLSSDAAIGAADMIFSDRDKVDSVVVTIYDPGEHLAGKAMISADEVKPSHVAEVIHKLITEGRYEDAPINLKLN